MIVTDWTPYLHFTEDEFRCKCGCGRADMKADFMEAVEALRRAYGRPIIISSGFRCPEHNAAVSSTGLAGPHTTGQAADIAIKGLDAYALLGHVKFPFAGIGIKQKGPHGGRFIHLDTLEDHETAGPRPWLWSY